MRVKVVQQSRLQHDLGTQLLRPALKSGKSSLQRNMCLIRDPQAQKYEQGLKKLKKVIVKEMWSLIRVVFDQAGH